MKYFLYRIDENGDAEIYGRFNSLFEAKMSARLLMIEDVSFILTGDIRKIYFFDDLEWVYDILDDNGQMEFLEMYPNPAEYQFD